MFPTKLNTLLSHLLWLLQATQKKTNSGSCPSNQVSAATMTSASEKKWRPFNCFSVQGTDSSSTGPHPENRVSDQHIGSPGRPVSSGLQVPSEPGYCRARTRPPWWTSWKFFLQKVLQLHQHRRVILRVDSLALWKIINEEDALLVPKKSRREIFQLIFTLGIFWGKAGWTAMPPLHWLLLCLRVIVIKKVFVHGQQSWQEIISIAPKKKFQKLLRRLAPLKFLICFQAFRDPLRGELPHVQIFMTDRPNQLTWDCSTIDLAKIRRSSKISLSIWSIISGWSLFWVVQDEAHQRWKNHHIWTGPPSFWRWHTMLHIPLMVLSEWHEYSSAPCLEGKKIDDSSRLDVFKIAHVAWHASFQPL